MNPPAGKQGMGDSEKMTGNNSNIKNHSTPVQYKGIIDVKSIDDNKDGKVFEDIMDWNVISDKPGTCPICGMTLKEFTIEQAEKNLKEHGFKVQ